MKPAFLVAGTASGVGKTTVTCALIAALRRRGLTVQPFKGGPDFLDTTHHSRFAGRASRNLDTWLLSAEANAEVFGDAMQSADAGVVEGMMGLFDGKSGTEDSGSSAEIARLLGLPVVLVVDASKTARSIAATVLGFELFDPTVKLAGVILNRVAGPRHLAMLRAAIEARCSTPVLGSLPRTPEIAIPERHLGLHAASTSNDPGEIAQELCRLADLADEHFELDTLLALAPSIPMSCSKPVQSRAEPVRIGFAQDEAFSFYYEDNFKLLRDQGAILVPFSPLHDVKLPEDLDAIYLGGGYPELHGSALSSNLLLLEELHSAVKAGLPVYAECGGMIYLGESLSSGSPGATAWPMAGVLPLHVEMTSRLVDFGYVTATFTRNCLLGPAGTKVRGHSFHYSRLTGEAAVDTAYELEFSLSGRRVAEGFTRGNVLGSYLHLHFRANPEIVPHFMAVVRACRQQRMAEVEMAV